ncbi:MAG: glycoside hydrolase family 127 protein [Chloroflexi bacterium]|nr:glycoside hydrolase family 127 protein [Chloroflexota bacterium]
MSTRQALIPFAFTQITLLPGELFQHQAANRRYLMSLENDKLLQNHLLEAGLKQLIVERGRQTFSDAHWGWESPSCQLRGHFLGHWLSAAARLYALTDDTEIGAKARAIVAELARCQRENGGEWAGSIPPTYLDWIARGKAVWAPHYTLHKTLMGLYEMYHYAGSEQALDILTRWAAWFHRWTAQFSRRQMDDILDVETGGMLEVWADLYGVTGRDEHLELIQRYDRPRLFEPLLAGEDVLTNRHANTTIPEAQGAARAWEVTGEERWRRIAEAYWRLAVEERGTFCTGGQTSGEIWTPPQTLAPRLGDKTQEHCVVYNMMRLAEYLYRWSGDTRYADYWERNLINGILAQHHPETGMVAYWLPLAPGSVKRWSTPRHSFWCCLGTAVQANAWHGLHALYEDSEGLVVAQYLPVELHWQHSGGPVTVRLALDPQTDAAHRPTALLAELRIECRQATAFTIKLRVPWWVQGEAQLKINGEPQPRMQRDGGYLVVRRLWQRDTLRLELPRTLTICPLPDRPNMVAFMDGPTVLAGLCQEERALYGRLTAPAQMLAPDDTRQWSTWKWGYRSLNQPRGLRFLPLKDILDEPYTVYFPFQPPEPEVGS